MAEPNQPADEERGEPPLLEALEKVRWRFLRIAIAVFGGLIIGFALVHFFGVARILVAPVSPYLDRQDGQLAGLSPMTPFMLELKVAFIVAVLLAFPVILREVWAHISGVLLAHEKRIILPSLFAGVFLFALGVYAGYLVLPWTLRWAFGFQADYVELVIEADSYLSFVVRLLLAFGFIFEMPVVVMILTALGIVTPRFLREKRRHAVVGATVVASLVTPGDVMSTLLMMVPMVILYEVSILTSQMLYGSGPRAGDAEEEEEEEETAGTAPG